jgi:hypothetical protein
MEAGRLSTAFLIEYAVLPGVVALIAWWLLLLALRGHNFTNGVQKDRYKRKFSDHADLLSQQIEYHNKATYRALEF